MSSAAIGYTNLVFDYEPLNGFLGSTQHVAVMRPQLSEQQVFTSTSAADGTGEFVIGLWYNGTPDPFIKDAVDVLGLLNVTHDGPASAALTTFTGLVENTAFSVPFTSAIFDGFPVNQWAVLPSTVLASQVLVRVAYVGATPSTLWHLRVGALWIGPLYRHPVGIDGDWSMQVEDPGQIGLSKGAQGYPQLRNKRRVFSGSFGPVDLSSAYGDPATPTVIDIQRLHYLLGTTKFAVFFPRLEDSAGSLSSHLIHRLGIYGAFRDIGTIRHLSDDNYSWGPVVFQELL